MNLLEILVKKNLVTEGIEDPAILKCIFFAGGPGAGKSYLVRHIFNVTKDLPLSSYGLKVIASDQEFEMLLKKTTFQLIYQNCRPRNLTGLLLVLVPLDKKLEN